MRIRARELLYDKISTLKDEYQDSMAIRKENYDELESGWRKPPTFEEYLIDDFMSDIWGVLETYIEFGDGADD